MTRLFLVLALILAACDETAPPSALPRVGDAAPVVTAVTLAGDKLVLPHNRPMILRFWASWCPGCRDGLGELQVVRPSIPDVLPIAINVGENPAQVAAFVRDLGLAYPLALDPDRAITRAYGITGLPATIVIDRHGVIHARLLGETDAVTLRAALRDLP